MTKDEALKMAIEALEDAQKCLMGHLSLEKLPYGEEINACKEALEKCDKCGMRYCECGEHDDL